MRHFKRSLLIWPFNTTLNDTIDGTWDATWTIRFFNRLEEDGWPVEQIPFAVDAPSWTRGMLQAAIWFAYYTHVVSLDAIVLPDNNVLPEYGVAPADDGMVGEPTSPACETITAARAASPNTAAVPPRRIPPMLVPVAVVTLLGAVAALTLLLRKGDA